MAILPEKPTMQDFQQYVRTMCRERGFDDNTHEEKLLLFVEEVGEMAKAMRKRSRLLLDPTKDNRDDLEGELADVLIYLLDIANGYGIDLEKAFREKEAINDKRSWK